MDINPDEIYEKLFNVGEAWVSAKAKYELLSDLKCAELSRLMIKHTKEGAKSNAEAKTRAEADPDYRAYIERMVKAEEEAGVAKVKYRAAEAWWEAKRTQAANHRYETRATQ